MRTLTPLLFLLAAPAVNPAVIVSTAVAFPGEHDIVAARFIASLLTAVLVGWWCLSRGSRLPLRRLEQVAESDASTRQKFVATIRHDFVHASGFLVLPLALPADTCGALRAAVAELRATKLAEGRQEAERTVQSVFSAAHDLQDSPVVADLLSRNRALPKCVDILGANCCLNRLQMEHCPPSGADDAGPGPLDFAQDLDRCNVDMGRLPQHPRPR